MTDLPPGWERATLDDLGVEAQAGFPSGKHNRDGDGIIHLRPMNITRNGEIDTSDVRYVHDEDGRRVISGDVLFNNTNSPELVGKTALFVAREPMAYSNHMTRVRPPDGLDPRFLSHQLHWLWGCGYFKTVMSNHVNQASVSSKVLLRTQIDVPPLAEQHRIVATLEDHLSRVNRATKMIDVVYKRSVKLRGSLLNEAFIGRLVSQEGDDEPASVLLERMKEQRTISKRPKGKRHGSDSQNAKRTAEGAGKDTLW